MAITLNLTACYTETTRFFSRVSMRVAQGSERVKSAFQSGLTSARTFGTRIHGQATEVTTRTREFTRRSREGIVTRYRQLSITIGQIPVAIARRSREFSNQAQQTINDTVDRVQQEFYQTLEQIATFAFTHKAELILGVSSIITATLSPGLFFSTMTISAIFTVIGHHFLKEKCAEYIKDEKNPFITNPTYGPFYATPLKLTMGIIGTLSALTLTCLDEGASWSLAFLPTLGGIAAGNVLGEMGLDIAHAMNAQFNQD